MLSSTEKSELKPIAAYINGLPPIEDWVNIRLELSPDIALEIETLWKWLGLSLDAYFSDASNPLPHAYLGESMKYEIQKMTSRYLSLSTLIFQAEHLIKKEARQLGITGMDSLSRSDILKYWAWEECFFQIWSVQQTHWESHTKAQMAKRASKVQKWASGEISDEELEEMKVEWAKEDAKLTQADPPDNMLWLTNLCLMTFNKYRAQLPEYSHYIQLSHSNKNIGKFMIVNADFFHPETRKEGKKKNLKKESLRSLLSKRHTTPS